MRLEVQPPRLPDANVRGESNGGKKRCFSGIYNKSRCKRGKDSGAAGSGETAHEGASTSRRALAPNTFLIPTRNNAAPAAKQRSRGRLTKTVEAKQPRVLQPCLNSSLSRRYYVNRRALGEADNFPRSGDFSWITQWPRRQFHHCTVSIRIIPPNESLRYTPLKRCGRRLCKNDILKCNITFF